MEVLTESTGADRHPRVLHIGFSKCASTYLRALFRSHPRIHLVFKSGYFTPFLAKEMTFAEYQSLFKRAGDCVTVESDEHLTLPGIHPELGIRTTNIDEFARVADRILASLPDVRIVMIVRNQASLIVSRYSEYLITGGSLGFEDFASKLMGERDHQNVFYQNYYFRLIQLLEERFPRANLLILLQEAMREDTRAVTTAISRFLGLNEVLAPKRGLRAERRSLSVAGMTLLRMANRYLVRRPSFGDAPPDTRVPLFLYRNVVRLVRAVDYFVLSRFARPSSTLLTRDRRRAILTHFLDDNLRLQSHFGRDIASFGYFAAEESNKIGS